MDTQTKRITVLLFTIYLLILAWILLFKLGVQFSYMTTRSVNLIPFKVPTILNGHVDKGEMILNVIVFFPAGVYVAMLFEQWRFAKKLLIVFLISFVIEALQYLFAIGAFDITDLITNTSGGLIGIIIYFAIEKILSSSLKAQKLINIIASVATVVLLTLLILLKLNMLPIRYQ